MARRRRPNWPLRWTLLSVVVATSAYIAWPLVHRDLFSLWANHPTPTMSPHCPSLSELYSRATGVVIGFWLFAFGSTIGSFLNVVVYRLPRNETLIWQPSRCPYCETPIEARDNVPIFGWIALRGRCRCCRLPISPRYPIVEFVTATLFLVLGWLEIVQGGVNLPGHLTGRNQLIQWFRLDEMWGPLRVYAYHCTLLALLLVAALMHVDRHRVPRRLTAFALLVGIGIPCFWPDLHPVHVVQSMALVSDAVDWRRGLLDGLAGLAAGTAVGTVVGVPYHASFSDTAHTRNHMALGWIGTYLGWQALPATGGLFVAFWLVAWLVFPRSVRRSALPVLLAASIMHLVFWRWLVLPL